jgi:hypothetical protein
LKATTTVGAGSSGGATCDSSRTGQIEFVGGQFRGCDGTDWRILETTDRRPLMKASASSHTLAQVRSLSGSTWPQLSGQGNVCESGYHICTWQEANVIKYSSPLSRIQMNTGQYYRTHGNHNNGSLAGVDHPHNALAGYDNGADWRGSSARCTSGYGPVIYFYSPTDRAQGIEWDGACYQEASMQWACCLNKLY